MKIRKKVNHVGKPGAILSADWHLRDDTPICRKDDFWTSQWAKIYEIFKLSNKFNVPVIVAGDVGHRCYWSDYLESKFIETVRGLKPAGVYCIPGQHDLPNHNLGDIHKSAFHLLETAGCFSGKFPVYQELFDVWGFPYGAKIKPPVNGQKSVMVWHHMVIEDKELWPGQVADNASQVLKKYPEYSLIVTGDNHLPFVKKIGNRLLVNPGSLTRMTAAQKNHRPRVYLWYPDSMSVETIFFDVNPDDISDKHVIEPKMVDERLSVFVKSLQNNQEVGLSFEKNLYRFMNDNRISNKVKDKVYYALEDK